MASNGYLCIVPDMLDGSAVWTTDGGGNDVWMDDEVAYNEAKPSLESTCDEQRKRQGIRTSNVNALGREIVEKGFLDKLGLAGGSPVLDVERLFIAGKSAGGWTSILCSSFDQQLFKVCLSFDPPIYLANDQIRNDKIELKVPTYMLQSQGFLGSQVPDMFEPKVKDSWEVYS